MLLLVNLNGRAPTRRSAGVVIPRESREWAPRGFSLSRACPPILSGVQGICIEEQPSLSMLRPTLKTFSPSEFQAKQCPAFALPQLAALQSPGAQHRASTTSPCYPSERLKPGSVCSHGEECHSHQDLAAHMEKHREKTGDAPERTHTFWAASPGRFPLC